MFERLESFIREANSTNSILDKVRVIEKYPDLKQIFILTYDTMNFTYGITSSNVKKLKKLGYLDGVKMNLPETLGALNRRFYTGHDAIKLVNNLVRDNPDYEDLIYRILDRNLKTRTDIKLINKVWPDLIQQFNVALAETYEEEMNIDFSKNRYLASRKCDGVRLITKIVNQKNRILLKTRKKVLHIGNPRERDQRNH